MQIPAEIPQDQIKRTEAKPDMFVIDQGRLRVRQSAVFELNDGRVAWLVNTGLETGKLTPHIDWFDAGKAKGKKTPFEQAVGEQDSKHKSKQKKDKYREGRENAIDPANDPYPPPMLAEKKEDCKIVFPCFGQRKLDGNRTIWKCHITGAKAGLVETYTREGNFLSGFFRITHAALQLAQRIHQLLRAGKHTVGEHVFLDGELFTLEYTFSELNGVRNLKYVDPAETGLSDKEKAKAIENQARRDKMQLWVYDIAIKNTPQDIRAAILHEACTDLKIPVGGYDRHPKDHPIVLEPYIVLADQKALDAFHGANVAAGFEGTIVRLARAGYQFDTRSKELIKVKDFLDAEFEVVDVVENDKMPDTGAFRCKFGDSTFDAMPEGSMEERRDMWKNRKDFIGKKINVKYFELHPDGKPRFPVARPFYEPNRKGKDD